MNPEKYGFFSFNQFLFICLSIKNLTFPTKPYLKPFFHILIEMTVVLFTENKINMYILINKFFINFNDFLKTSLKIFQIFTLDIYFL